MTREEIENIPKNINTLFDLRQKLDEKLNKVCELAIKTLEQELIFDKIRTEIKCMEYIEGSVNNSDEYEAAKEDALKIIDKYRQTEQEPKTDGVKTDLNGVKTELEQKPKTDVLDKIRAEIKQLPYQRIFGNVSSYSLLDTVIEIIDKYRQVEQEPRTGHWIKLDVWYGCSECSLTTNERGKNFYRYCPNCGAKMVEPQESEKV